ncbi:hydroxydechloroatrazine ethylaminohydrolase [Frigoribacterium sp. RIT-PI-h]|nr:8-oxoguanine deaminase [Frigoribacterium sp. RIT-PI-h]KPG84397.1 hydroxydechloroatrazine ethylaminohydrolase [Frigoribacterium sp. RIT-PI-h]
MPPPASASASAAPTRRLVVENAHVATVDDHDTEHAGGHVVVDGSRIVAVGPGPAPAWCTAGLAAPGSVLGSAAPAAAPIPVERVDGRGHLLTPGLVNTHHHLYQWLTRGIAQDSILFAWLVALSPPGARLDGPLVEAGAAAAIAVLARSGCTTVGDHHYVFPAGAGDLLGGIVRAAATVGVRLHATRGSMDLGRSQGGLPPDFAVETTDAALRASQEAVARFHDPSGDARAQIAIAPCSPFSVPPDLLREAAVLGRQLGVRLHTHGSETVEEDAFCLERLGRTPTQYLEDLGWLGDDVWMAHCVHLDDHAIGRFAATGTGVAHCPSSNGRLAAGIAPIASLLRAGAPVGLGVDGAASNESGQLGTEFRQAVLFGRLRSGADAFSVRQGLRLATMGGARVLGRDADLGSIEVGKLAVPALGRVGGVAFAGIADPVAARGRAGRPPRARLWVGGDPVVRDGELVHADQGLLAEGAARASADLRARV